VSVSRDLKESRRQAMTINPLLPLPEPPILRRVTRISVS
jgi:hypothetical protein